MPARRLQDRVVVVASAVFLAAIVAAVVLVDHRHRLMVLERAALEAGTLRVQLTSRARVAPVVDSDEVRVAVPAETAAVFFDPGRSALITARGSLLWRSAGRAPEALLDASAAETAPDGIVSAGGSEFYRASVTVPHRLARPVAEGEANAGGGSAGPGYYRYEVTYRVLLDYAPFRRDIEDLRIDMAGVVLVAMLLLFFATRAAIHRQLRPLARVTADVSRLGGTIGESVARDRRDPEEIRVLAERINRFLAALDETRRWEQETHRHIRAALDDMKNTMLAEEVSRGGLMHSLNHMLSDILLMDFRTVSEADKAELRQSVVAMRDMLEKRLNLLVSERAAGPVPAVDIVPEVERFRILMARRFAGRKFVIEAASSTLRVRVAPEDFAEMVGNLLRNAGFWSREAVLLRLSEAGGMARIAVEDDGPGFPAQDRDRLLAWGGAGGSRSGGHGIGLPYVNGLARGYGGALSIGDSDRLGGAMAVLDLPLCPDPAPRPPQ